jgi:hypothetical protein
MTRRLLTVLTLVLLSRLWGADKAAPLVVVRDVRTNLGYVGSPEFLKLLVRFKATFRNSGNTDIRVAPEPIFMSGVQRQDETGEWRTLQAHHWYDFGQIQYKMCTTVRPGDAFELSEVDTSTVLRKDERPSPAYVVLRFHLESVCKEGDEVFWQVLVTEPVKAEVPH